MTVANVSIDALKCRLVDVRMHNKRSVLIHSNNCKHASLIYKNYSAYHRFGQAKICNGGSA